MNSHRKPILLNLQLSIVLLLLSFFFVQKGSAQGKVDLTWTIAPSLALQPGVNNLDIEIENTGSVVFKGYVSLELPSDLTSLSSARVAVEIDAGKKRFMSLKLRSETLSLLKGKRFRVLLSDNSKQELLSKYILLEVPYRRSVQLQDNSSIQYLRNIGDSIQMQLRVVNTGTTDEQVKILFSSPDRIGKIVFQEINLQLTSGEDTLIRRSFVIERYMMNLAQYTVRVAGIYDNNDVFGNVNILYANIVSERNYQQMFAPDHRFAGYNPNYLEFRVSSILDPQPSYNILSEGSYRLGGGRLGYAVSANHWGGDKYWNINNTFLTYERRGHGVTVGNIQESLEAPFYGRGAAYTYQDTASDQRFSGGFIQRTHDLLGYYGPDNPGFTAFARVQLADQESLQKRYDGQVLYDQNRQDSVTSILWTNRFDILKKKHAEGIRLEGFLGAGVQQYHGFYRKDETSMPSIAMGLKMDQQLRKWSFSSDNYYSSGYFPGNRRGAVQLSQRVNRRLRHFGLGLGYSYTDYRPEYLNPYYRTFSSGVSRWDVQFSFPLSSVGQFSIIPSYNKEYADYMVYEDIIKRTSRSALLLVNANLRSRNLKHSLFFTLEGGSMSLENISSRRFVFRTDVSYNYERFGVFGNYQNGPFQVYDMMSAFILGREFGSRYLLGMRYQGSLMQRKLRWNTSVNGQMNQGWGKTLSGNLFAEYQVAKKTHLQTTFQYMYNVGVTNYRYDNANLQVGVRQQFNRQSLERVATKSGDLKLFCYYDNNGNDIFDAGDERASDYGFMVRNILFVTDKKGEASFKKMPYGSYMLFFPLKNQYQGGSRSVDIDAKSMRIEVALQKVGSVYGRLLLDYDPALQLPIDTRLSIYTISARNEQGRVFTATSDAKGFFELHLPEGTYTVYPDVSKFQQHVYLEDSASAIRIDPGRSVDLGTFRLKVKAKKIDVKRFSIKK
ncbi:MULTISPECIES: carboxypeptidase-like regulatory domain-containing protein [Sphingobacterium]|uniref:carboxypeptidase-like regulatory domain-containing protein n=1 Tax=Sphingobacterium TaxID=28453 RepID=UPI0013DAF77D|nr:MULTISPECIES: carboxypeptidase-like regulatory domain-containing protein [unclassified Sphingobacterium]